MAYNTDATRVALAGMIKGRAHIYEMYVALIQSNVPSLITEAGNVMTNVIVPLDAEIVAVEVALAAA